MLYLCKLVLCYLVDHGNLIENLFIMAKLITILLCMMERKLVSKPMTPEQILKDDLARASRAKTEEKNKSENQIVAADFVPPKTTKYDSTHATEIRLKSPCMLANKIDIAELDVNNTQCYAIICKEVLFSFEDMPPSLPPPIANLLQEYEDVFPAEMPPGLPPIRGIEHQIDLIPGATLPNRAPYRTNDRSKVSDL